MAETPSTSAATFPVCPRCGGGIWPSGHACPSDVYVTPGHPVRAGAGYDCACGECLAVRKRRTAPSVIAAIHVDPLEPPIATRPQDWTERARRIIFGRHRA